MPRCAGKLCLPVYYARGACRQNGLFWESGVVSSAGFLQSFPQPMSGKLELPGWVFDSLASYLILAEISCISCELSVEKCLLFTCGYSSCKSGHRYLELLLRQYHFEYSLIYVVNIFAGMVKYRESTISSRMLLRPSTLLQLSNKLQYDEFVNIFNWRAKRCIIDSLK